MRYTEIDAHDEALISAAIDALRRNYQEDRHTVGAAIRCASGKIYTGVNIESCGYGPCAEPVALGTAITQGEREFIAVVAVCRREDAYGILPPCGNCRQMLLNYAPDAYVILEQDGKRVKVAVKELLPCPYTG
ncbi:MAG: cytidine deaminase [Chloroflexi bacterium]|nr:cytidine deaminase [Chloroflexota bacterium]